MATAKNMTVTVESSIADGTLDPFQYLLAEYDAIVSNDNYEEHWTREASGYHEFTG